MLAKIRRTLGARVRACIGMVRSPKATLSYIFYWRRRWWWSLEKRREAYQPELWTRMRPRSMITGAWLRGDRVSRFLDRNSVIDGCAQHGVSSDMKSAQHGASPLSSMGSGRRGSGRVGSGLKRVQEIQCRFRKNTPPPTPTPTSESTPKRTLGDRTRPPGPMFESRRVTLECLTLKMREKVRRSFVTDLAVFRHLFIRQPVGFVIRTT
jgi:hypothetical protein